MGGADRIAQAPALVAEVPTDFVYEVEYSTNTDRQNNAVFSFNNLFRRFGVADREGGNGLPFVLAQDPRVPTQTSTRNGLDGVNVRIVNQLRYPDRTSSIPLASGVEARLIQAEAALLVAGDRAGFAQQLNAAWATVDGLTPLTVAGLTDRALADLLFCERGFFLFATGHRLGDMRRLLRPPYSTTYGFTYEQVYPVGDYGSTASSRVSLSRPRRRTARTSRPARRRTDREPGRRVAVPRPLYGSRRTRQFAPVRAGAATLTRTHGWGLARTPEERDRAVRLSLFRVRAYVRSVPPSGGLLSFSSVTW